ncbi:MAG: hypothetical protein ACHQ53_08940 [Polyangiales bacterium]
MTSKAPTTGKAPSPPATKAQTAVIKAVSSAQERVATRASLSLEAIEQEATRGRSWRLLTELHGLFKAAQLHDVQHPVAKQAAAALCEAVAGMPPPFVVQFVAGGMFVDRALVPLDFPHFERCQVVTHALDKLAAHELSFETPLGPAGALQLAQAMVNGLRGQTKALNGVEIAGLAWREIPFAQSGIDAEGVDPDVAVIAHTLLGLSVAEQIAERPDQPWPWSMGLAVVRRLEKGLATNAGSSMRVVEFAPEGWPIARRALSACQLVLQVLTRVGMDATNRRAAAHAALALALSVLKPPYGLEAAAAADALAKRMLRATIQAESGVAPQCLLVATLVHQLGAAMRARRGPGSLIVTDLIDLAYEMERARCPARVPFDLGRADLLAFVVQNEGVRFSPDWVRVVIKVCGAVPVGACVQLKDGRIGVVIEPGPPHAPFCPVVFAEGARVVTREPVMLVPPNKVRRIETRTRAGH